MMQYISCSICCVNFNVTFASIYFEHTRFMVYTLVCIDLETPKLNPNFRDNDRVRISCTVTGHWTTLTIEWNPTPASIGGVNPPTVIDDFTRKTSQTADVELSNCVEYKCMVSAGRAVQPIFLHSNYSKPKFLMRMHAC